MILTPELKVYRLYSDQQAYDGWESHNEYGIFTDLKRTQELIDALIEEEEFEVPKKERAGMIVAERSEMYARTEDGVYIWKVYIIKEYTLNEIIEDDLYTKDIPRTPKFK